jgi:hypothetical protein
MVKMGRFILPIKARFMMSLLAIYGKAAPIRDFMMPERILLKPWMKPHMGLKFLKITLLSEL